MTSTTSRSCSARSNTPARSIPASAFPHTSSPRNANILSRLDQRGWLQNWINWNGTWGPAVLRLHAEPTPAKPKPISFLPKSSPTTYPRQHRRSARSLTKTPNLRAARAGPGGHHVVETQRKPCGFVHPGNDVAVQLDGEDDRQPVEVEAHDGDLARFDRCSVAYAPAQHSDPANWFVVVCRLRTQERSYGSIDRLMNGLNPAVSDTSRSGFAGPVGRARASQPRKLLTDMAQRKFDVTTLGRKSAFLCILFVDPQSNRFGACVRPHLQPTSHRAGGRRVVVL